MNQVGKDFFDNITQSSINNVGKLDNNQKGKGYTFKQICDNSGIKEKVSSFIGNSLIEPSFKIHKVSIFESYNNEFLLNPNSRLDMYWGYSFEQMFHEEHWINSRINTAIVLNSNAAQGLTTQQFIELSQYILNIYSIINHDSSVHSNGLGPRNKNTSEIQNVYESLIDSESSLMKNGKGEILAGIIHKELMQLINIESNLFQTIHNNAIRFFGFLNRLPLTNQQYYYFLQVYSEAFFCIINPQSKIGKEMLDLFGEDNWSPSRFGEIIHNTEVKGMGINHKEILNVNASFNSDISNGCSKNTFSSILREQKGIRYFDKPGNFKPIELEKAIKKFN